MGSMLFSAPIIASSVPDCHQILRKSCQESVRKGLRGTEGSNPVPSTGESVLACDQPRNQTPNHQSSPVLNLPIGADQDPTETGIRVGKSNL